MKKYKNIFEFVGSSSKHIMTAVIFGVILFGGTPLLLFHPEEIDPAWVRYALAAFVALVGLIGFYRFYHIYKDL